MLFVKSDPDGVGWMSPINGRSRGHHSVSLCSSFPWHGPTGLEMILFYGSILKITWKILLLWWNKSWKQSSRCIDSNRQATFRVAFRQMSIRHKSWYFPYKFFDASQLESRTLPFFRVSLRKMMHPYWIKKCSSLSKILLRCEYQSLNSASWKACDIQLKFSSARLINFHYWAIFAFLGRGVVVMGKASIEWTYLIVYWLRSLLCVSNEGKSRSWNGWESEVLWGRSYSSIRVSTC